MAEPKTFEETYAAEIRERMAAGLTRDQAIAVQKAQNDWDRELAEREAAATKGTKPPRTKNEA